MFRKKSKFQWSSVILFILMIIGLIGTPLAQAQNWVSMAPYNLLWPVWTPVLSPLNPLTGLRVPLVSEVRYNTILSKQPAMLWDPSKESVYFIYNIPQDLGGGLIAYMGSEQGLQPWPPSYLINFKTGEPAPLELPRNYESLHLPDTQTQKEFIIAGNYAYLEKYPGTTLLSPDLLFSSWQCYPALPAPELVVTGTEDFVIGNQEKTRYRLGVLNWEVYPDELFDPAPELPPCGLNTNSPRTWVDVYSWDGTRLMGYCSLASTEGLNSIWFAVPKGEAPPECVYITLEDRYCNNFIYTSNCAPTTEGPWEHCVDFEYPPLDTTYHVPETFVDSGVTISLEPFQGATDGYAYISNGGQAGGSGQEVWTNNVNLRFHFPVPPNGLSLKFGAYGGILNIRINGEFKTFGHFTDLHGSTIGGVGVSVETGFGTAAQGILILEGEITGFEIGGQELAIDDVCPHREGAEVYFADDGEVPGSVYHYRPAIGVETTIYTRPQEHLSSFTFSPWDQNKLYFVNANSNQILVKDLSTSSSPETVVYTFDNLVRDIAFNSEGAFFFSEATGSGADGKIWRWEKDGSVSLFYTVNLSAVDGFWSGDFAFDSEDTLYLSSGNRVPASIYRVDVLADTVTKVYTDHHEAIAGMVFLEGSLLYYANWDTKIYRLNLEGGERGVIYQNPSRQWLSDVAFPVPEILPTDAEGTWIMPYGIGGTRLDQIDANGLTDYTDSISGHYMEDAPFGARLGFRLGSAMLIPTPLLKYYRFQYRHESETGWHDFEEPVFVHYVKEKTGEPPKFPLYKLGPNDIGGKNLYEFRPHESDLPSLVSPGPGETVYWPTTGFLGDIYSGFLNTEALHLAPGRYQIKVGVYNALGNQVSPGAGGFDFVVPIGVTGGTILTDTADPGSIDAGGFVFTIHVDNRVCGAEIDEPSIHFVGAGDCGFLTYNPNYDPGTAPVHISFHATHPDNFALFRFRIVRGPNNIASAYVNGHEVSALSAGVYTGDGIGNFANDFLRTDLLGPCVEAAFSENLYTFAKATTGWHHRINRFDAWDIRAFALTPEESEFMTFGMHLSPGWSMISLPVEPEDARMSTLFPGVNAVFRFTDRYELLAPNDSLEKGVGYWIYVPEPRTYLITGTPFVSYTILNAPAGWSMIGGCYIPAQPSVMNGEIGAVFGFTNQYILISSYDNLEPGHGYWINLSMSTTLTVQ